jgi:hypothetical protein
MATAPNFGKDIDPMNVHSDILKQNPEIAKLDPVLVRAQQLQQLWGLYLKIDESKGAIARPDEDAVSHHIFAVEHAIGAEKARSAAGALAQIALANNALDSIDNMVICHLEYDDAEIDKFQFMDSCSTLRRILYSVADVMREHCAGLDLLSEHYMSKGLSPWTVSDRVQEVLDASVATDKGTK